MREGEREREALRNAGIWKLADMSGVYWQLEVKILPFTLSYHYEGGEEPHRETLGMYFISVKRVDVLDVEKGGAPSTSMIPGFPLSGVIKLPARSRQIAVSVGVLDKSVSLKIFECWTFLADWLSTVRVWFFIEFFFFYWEPKSIFSHGFNFPSKGRLI